METTTYQLTRQDLIYVALIGAGIGLILGLIPLIVAIRKGRTRLGSLAVILSTLTGAASPLLSLIVIAIFIWLLLRKGRTPETQTTPTVPDPDQSE